MTSYIADNMFDPAVFSGASCAFGVFDGMHTGHRFLLDQAMDTARESDARSVAITFDTDPDETFRPDKLKKIMSDDERIAALVASGVDDVVVLPFSAELARQEPDDFLARTFREGAPGHLHIGCDFRFGARASGTVDTLKEWGAREGCTIHGHHLLSAHGQPVTATRIRKLLQQGLLDEAQALLGNPYVLESRVVSGRGEGTGFGFATANLVVDSALRVLGDGVYAAWAYVDGERHKAAVSVGVSPTFEDATSANIEAHLLDFEGSLVGKPIRLEFAKHLRPMKKFESTEALIEAVTADIDHVRSALDA